MATIDAERDVAVALIDLVYRHRALRHGVLALPGDWTVGVALLENHIVVAAHWECQAAIELTVYPLNFVACWASYARTAMEEYDVQHLPQAMEEVEASAWDFWMGADPADFDGMSLCTTDDLSPWIEHYAQETASFIDVEPCRHPMHAGRGGLDFARPPVGYFIPEDR